MEPDPFDDTMRLQDQEPHLGSLTASTVADQNAMQWESLDGPPLQLTNASGQKMPASTSEQPALSTSQEQHNTEAAAVVPASPQQLQQLVQQQGVSQADDIYIHALLPTQLARRCVPHLSIMQDSAPQNGRSSKQRDKEPVLLLDKLPMHQLTGPNDHFVYWCSGPVSRLQCQMQDSSSSTDRHSSTKAFTVHAAVVYEVPRWGILPGSKKQQLQQKLLSGCSHHYLFPSCAEAASADSAEAATTAAPEAAHANAPALMALMARVLLQQLQSIRDLPTSTKQLHNLAQYICTSSSTTIVDVVLLLTEQLLLSNTGNSDSIAAAQSDAACMHQDTPSAMDCDAVSAHNLIMVPQSIPATLTAYTAILLIAKVGLSRSQLARQQQQQVQQAASAILKAFAMLSHSCKVPACNSSSCIVGQPWLQELQECLRKSITAAAAGAVLQCCNLRQELSWLAALPALVKCMQTPTLDFLYTLPDLPRAAGTVAQYHQNATAEHTQWWQQAGSYAATITRVFQQLADISPRLTKDVTLQRVVLALVPGLLGVLQLSVHLLPVIQEQHRQGNRYAYDSVAYRIQEAVKAAMKQAPLEELLQCWEVISQHGQQNVYRQCMQQAVVDVLLQLPMPGSSTPSGSRGAAASLARREGATATQISSYTLDKMSHGCTPAEALLKDQLIFGDLFDSGPSQLLRMLCQTVPSCRSSWPAFLSYEVVPAALNQLLQRPAAAASVESPDQDTEKQHEQQQFNNAIEADILQFVQHWLRHQHVAAVSSSASCTHSYPSSTVQLYCAAELLMHNCTAETLGQLDVDIAPATAGNQQGRLHWRSRTLLKTKTQRAQKSNADSSDISTNDSQVLQYVLHVLADEQCRMLQQQPLQVLQASGALSSFPCRKLLQQHYLATLHHWLQSAAAAPGTMSPSKNVAALAPQLHLHQLVQSSVQAADVYVSAVLGCGTGSNGCNMLATGAEAAHTGVAGMSTATVVAANDEGPWSSVAPRKKRQRQQYRPPTEQQQQQQHITADVLGVSWLQQQVLQLLADCLLTMPNTAGGVECSTAVPGYALATATPAAAACVEATSLQSQQVAIVKLLLGTDDLLQGHFLWVKLLHGLLPRGPSHDNISSGSTPTEHIHAVAAKIVGLVCHLYDELHSGSITVHELDRLQQYSQPLAALVDAVATALPLLQPLEVLKSGSCSATELHDALRTANMAVHAHRQQLQALERFYNVLCPSVGATLDLDSSVSDLSAKAAHFSSLLVKHLRTAQAWDKHWLLLQSAVEVHALLGTMPFVNSLKLSALAMAANDAASCSVQQAGQQENVIVIDVDDDETSRPEAASTAAAGSYEAAATSSFNVAEVHQLMPQLLQDFRSRWFALVDCQAGSMSSTQTLPGMLTVAAVLSLWVGETVPDVESEYSIIMQWLSSKPPQQQPEANAHAAKHALQTSTACVSPDAVSALLRLYHASRERPLGEELEALHAAFSLVPSSLLSAVQLLPKVPLTEVQLPVVQLAAAYATVEQGLGALAGQFGLLQQLGRSAALQEFLATTSADDLRRLVDGAEDHGDTFVRSAVLSDLLEVNRLLQQLRQLATSGTATLEQLIHTVIASGAATARHQATHNTTATTATANTLLSANAGQCSRDVSDTALSAVFSRLAAQLQVCNENVHSFKALYGRLSADRSELTREVVLKVMQHGTYSFAVCTNSSSTSGHDNKDTSGDAADTMCGTAVALCSYPRCTDMHAAAVSNSMWRSLQLDDLHELKSRVMLLAGSSSVSLNSGASAPIAVAVAAGEPAKLSSAALAAFVTEVDLTDSIMRTVNDLLDVGCFSYSSWQHQVPATDDPLQRCVELQHLLATLQHDLATWKQQLALAQAHCKWLNYFQPCQLFLLHKVLCCPAATAMRSHTSTAVLPVPDQHQLLAALADLQFVRPSLTNQHLQDVVSKMALQQAQCGMGSAAMAISWSRSHLAGALDRLFKKANSLAGVVTQEGPCSEVINTADTELGSGGGSPGVLTPAVQAAVDVCLQLVAALETLFNDSTAASQQSSALMQLCHLTSDNPASQHTPATLEGVLLRDSAYKLRESLITLVVKDATASSIGVMLQACAKAGCSMPQPSQVVFCSSSTSWWEVRLLLQRCFPVLALVGADFDGGSTCFSGTRSSARDIGSASSAHDENPAQLAQHTRTVYCLCDADTLPLSMQTQLAQMLLCLMHGKQAGPSAMTGQQDDQGLVSSASFCRLVVTCSSPCSYLPTQLSAHSSTMQLHTPDSWNLQQQTVQLQHVQLGCSQAELSQLLQHTMQKQDCCAVVVSSDLPGQGKSAAVARLAGHYGLQLYHVLLADDLSVGGVCEQLRPWNPATQLLHVNLLSCSDLHAAEHLLFSLLVLSHVADGKQAYHRPSRPCVVAVEVANSVGEGLLLQMPMLAAGQQLQQSHALYRLVSNDASMGQAASPFSGCSTSSSTNSQGQQLFAAGYWHLGCSFNLAHVDATTADMRLLCTHLALQGAGLLDAVPVMPDASLPANYQAVAPNAAACRQLLQQAFVAGREAVMSFTVLQTFVSIAARQLRHMSGSWFFQPETLQWVQNGAASQVRSQLLRAIIEAAASFAVDSCSAVKCKQHQHQQADKAGNAAARDAGLQLASRAGSIISWADSNHLLLLFNAADEHQSITALYRQPQHVPDSFRHLLASQAVLQSDETRAAGGLVDYTACNSSELLDTLLSLVSSGSYAEKEQRWTELVTAPYILTADNLLKMSLIYTRIQAGLPVLMMGDTGCGKTSLLKFLADASGVKLCVLNVHGGTTRKQIMEAVDKAEHFAGAHPDRQVWLFFDEANTCNQQGLIAALISHRQLPGNRSLHPAITPLAAVNPYRLKPTRPAAPDGSSTTGVLPTAGLTGKLPTAVTGLARLVYTVQPLPETVMDHVWDFGVLSNNDERGYIAAMVSQASVAHSSTGGSFEAASGCCTLLDQQLLVDVLCCSQQFIRSCGQDWDVSLRDVRRCIRLASWFERNMRNRPKPKRQTFLQSACSNPLSVLSGLLTMQDCPQQHRQQLHLARVQLQGLVLALLHTYHSRLAQRADRRQYLQKLVAVFKKHGKTTSPAELMAILTAEQDDYLRRMELPPGIAVNEALRENVFMTLVCVLNKIPLFLVGKPGSSKSLALRLIHANLRGPDSSDDFFRQLPTLLFFSFQGSESSTSDGISKTFAAAKSAAAAAGAGTIAVVLLDEVGLAEISPHNPLKALHAELEPGYPAESPDVAVVGISNWALDAAKLSRAVLLSRPEPEESDLASTATTIWHAAHATTPDAAKSRTLAAVAAAYYEHYNSQVQPDFHGLRDYYGLVRTLRLQPQLSPVQLYRAVLRNFGGPQELVQQVMSSFARHVVAPPSQSLPSTVDLIRDNLQDKSARHLLLISSGDIVVDVVRNILQSDQDQQVSVVWGSPWPEDQSDAYRYSLLGRIILHMEMGHKLILRDCGIFGALYDMLNQNYSTVGGRHNCRIALGPHSNPMCAVHDDFRAVVVMTPAQAAAADPSLLNRFEKQCLECSTLLPFTHQQLLLQPLEGWMDSLAAASNGSSSKGVFTADDVLLGLHNDSASSLLLRLTSATSGDRSSSAASAHPLASKQKQQELLDSCRSALTCVASLDGIARACSAMHKSTAHAAASSSTASVAAASLSAAADTFLTASKHSMRQFVDNKLAQHVQNQEVSGGVASKDEPRLSSPVSSLLNVQLWYIMTRSGAHVAVAPLLQQLAQVDELFIEQIKSETELKQQVLYFLSLIQASSPAAGCGSKSKNKSAVRLLVVHATAPAAAAELRHLRNFMVDCLKQHGCKIPPWSASGAVREESAGATQVVDAMEWQQGPTAAPLIAVCIVVHLPIAAAAAVAASRAAAVLPSHVTATRVTAHTSKATSATPKKPAAQPQRLPNALAFSKGAAAISSQDGWQCSWLSDWQQVTIDSLEGVKPWLWQVLANCSLRAAAGLDMQLPHTSAPAAGAVAAAAVAALPISEMLQSALLKVLCTLPYPDISQAAVRMNGLADRLLTQPGHGEQQSLWSVLCTAVQQGLLHWPAWEEFAVLELAGDAGALQLHGSFTAAAEAFLMDELCRQLRQLLLGLELHTVLDAYWAADTDMQQVVHELLLSGCFTAACSQQQTVMPPIKFLQLQLPISGLCYKLLQSSCPRLQELLQEWLAPASAAVDDHIMEDAPADHAHANSESHRHLLYRLDALLSEAVKHDRVAALLHQHTTAYIQDMLLLALADVQADEGLVSRTSSLAQSALALADEGTTATSSTSLALMKLPLHHLQQLLLSYQVPELHNTQHPVLWHLLLQQHHQQLKALADICSAVATPSSAAAASCSHSAGGSLQGRSMSQGPVSNSRHSTPTDMLHHLVQHVYQSLLPSRDCIAACGGFSAWQNKCREVLAAAAALHSCLGPDSRTLVQNIDVLGRLSDLVVGDIGTKADLSLLANQLQLLADKLKTGLSAVTEADNLEAVLAAAQQLSAQQCATDCIDPINDSSNPGSGSSRGTTQQQPSQAHAAFVAWLLSASITAAANTATSASLATDIEQPPPASDLLQVIARNLFGQYCNAAMLPQVVQLLQLSSYARKHNTGQQLLQDVQVLGLAAHVSTCPVWMCLHRSLTDAGCGPDDPPIALLALAVQQCWFGEAFTNTVLQRDQQHLDANRCFADWVGRAGVLLCKQGLPLVQLTVVVAFLRAVIDTVAPEAVATASAAATRPQSKPRLPHAASCSTNTPLCSSQLLSAVGKLFAAHGDGCNERLHTLLLYLLKAMKGARTFAELQQICKRIGANDSHPLQPCMAGPFAASTDGNNPAAQQQHLLPVDPYTQLPQYQHVLQLLSEAAARPAAAAGLLKPHLTAAMHNSTTARAWLAALVRQVYLVRGLGSNSGAANMADSGAARQGGLSTICSTMKAILQSEPDDTVFKQFMLTVVGDTWSKHASSMRSGSSSEGSSRSSGKNCKCILHLGPAAAQEQLYICSAVMHLASALLTADLGESSHTAASRGSPSTPAGTGFAAPLLLYMTHPAAARQQYMLGMPGDEATQLLNSIARAAGGTTVYRCACGLLYLIGDCGRQNQRLKCPECQLTLGASAGQTFVAQAGAVPERQQLGYINTHVTVGAVAAATGSTSSNAGQLRQITGSELVNAAATVGVRDLNPASCQLLRLLVHAALLVGSAAQLQAVGGLASLLGVANDDVARQHEETSLMQLWQLLRRSCQATDEQLHAVLLNAVDAICQQPLDVRGGGSAMARNGAWQLGTPAERSTWEGQFAGRVTPFIQNPSKTLQQLVASKQASVVADSTVVGSNMYLECAVQEVLDLAADASYRTRHLPTLFRRIALPSIDALAAHFWSDPQNAVRYPVTLAVLQERQQQRLQLLPSLHKLVQFEAGFRQHFSGIVNRADATSVPLTAYVTSVPASNATGSTSAEVLAAVSGATSAATDSNTASHLSLSQLQQFIRAWNAVRHIITRHECKDVVVPELDIITAPASVACISGRDEGRLLLAMLTELARRQNAFLLAATGQQVHGQQAEAQDQGDSAEQALQPVLKTKTVQAVKQADVVDVSAAMQQLLHLLSSPGCTLAWPGLAYGGGQTLHYNLTAVEQLLHSSLVGGKRLIDAETKNIQEFVFEGEMFLRASTLLYDVEQKVPQQDVAAPEQAELAAAVLQQLPPGTAPASMLPHLEVLLSFVQKTGGSPSSSVAKYITAWLPAGPSRQFMLACPLMQQLQLQQIVALYEALEDVIAADVRIEDSIGSNYRTPLGLQLERHLLDMVAAMPSETGNHNATVPASVAVPVLRRLMLRFLKHTSDSEHSCQQQAVLQPDVPLSIYCCDERCCRWPWQQIAASKAAAQEAVEHVFADQLLMAHIGSVVKLLHRQQQ